MFKVFVRVLLLTAAASCAFAANDHKQISTGAQNKKPPRTLPSEYKGTVEGLVRDVACPIQNHKSTALDFNMKCAVDCAKSGSPLIILTKAGDIYTPISNEMPDPSQREKMMPFLGKYVRAKGTIYTRNGTRAIAITEIEELKGVKLNGDLTGD